MRAPACRRSTSATRACRRSRFPGGFCFDDPSFLLLLAVNTWERQTHANAPASFEWDIDIDQDGDADYAVFNFDLAGDLTDGRNAVFAERSTETTTRSSSSPTTRRTARTPC